MNVLGFGARGTRPEEEDEDEEDEVGEGVGVETVGGGLAKDEDPA